MEFVYRASLRGVFFSKAVSYGNAADLNECDLLEYFTHDPETSIIACYIEGIRGGLRFFEVLSQAASVKPVVLLKGGRGKAGTRAVASHTASLAGSTQIWRSAVTQAGAIWAETIEEMTDIAVALRFMERPRGPRVGIICGGGATPYTAPTSVKPQDSRSSLCPSLRVQGSKTISPTPGSTPTTPSIYRALCRATTTE